MNFESFTLLALRQSVWMRHQDTKVREIRLGESVRIGRKSDFNPAAT
jgi:hypothetical protein